MRHWTIILAAVLITGAYAPATEISVRLPDGTETKADLTQPATLTLKDGTRLVGVDLRWYAGSKKPAEPLTDDNKKSITELLTVPSFYDKVNLLTLQGDADRAIGLVELVRDRDFYAGAGQVIWRIEVWYFQFQNGGWAKVNQQVKLIDRQRFPSHEAYRKYTAQVRFVPKLGAETRNPSTTRPAELTLEPADLIKPTEPQ